MSRTPLFAALRHHLRLALLAAREGAPPLDELVERDRRERWTRRRFVATSSAAGLALATGCAGRRRPPASRPTAASPVDGTGPRIAIVGGGIAGLDAAWRLAQAGVRAEIYEGAKRTGGRMHTATGLLGPGLTTEIGGEFIDSNHEEILALVDELGLSLVDTQVASEIALATQAYHFGGRLIGEGEIVAAFVEPAARMAADLAGLGETVDFQDDGGARDLDHTSIADYLRRIGVSGWLKDLLEVAYVTEYGLDAGEQSALNLLYLISTDLEPTDANAPGFEIFGESDERYKVQGGNQRIPDELAKRLEDRIHRERVLRAVHQAGAGYRLAFEQPGGSIEEVTADVVLLTVPFSILRDIEIGVDLPEVKRKAIRELGYGTNAKVMVGTTRRVWRDLGYTGGVFSDQPFQLAWDSSQLQPGEAGGLTLYSGGRPGVEVGLGTAEEQARRLLTGLEGVYPGVTATLSGKFERFHWPSFRFTKGSYACYRPGQWTTIGGAEILPVGALYFAGEHTSSDFQGFMNGGAETGRRAAEAILERLGKRQASRVRRRRFAGVAASVAAG